MSFIKPQEEEMVRRYGRPDYLTTTQKMASRELEIVRSSMKDGRAHDITLYIRKDGGFIFIAKPPYPSGLFRAPSGGILPDENFETGARREALEETGLEIELEKYILKIDVRFQSGEYYIDWTSHIFEAYYVDGDIAPKDTREIREARLVMPDEIPGFVELMSKSGLGGLVYRAYLTKEAGKRL